MNDPAIPVVVNDHRSLRIWLARGLAVAADAVQIGLFPVTVEGAVSPFVDVLDVGVAVVLTMLVGWHIAFLPSFIVKVVPFADLAPTWTLAVFIATRGAGKPTAARNAALDQPMPSER